jgi:PAS domain S-box-containing protein
VSSRASFAGYVGVGLAGVVAYQFLTGIAAVVVYGLVGLWGIAGTVVGARRFSGRAAAARYAIVAGLTLLVAGDMEWFVEDLVGRDIPIPGASDVLYLTAYPILAAGLFFLSRRRSRANLLDAITVTLSVATVLWSPLFASFEASGGAPLAERLTLGAYPAWDLLLLLLAARLAFGRSLSSAWRVILVSGLLLLLVGDLMWAASAETYVLGDVVDTVWLVSYVLLGASGVHRSAAAGDRRELGAELYARRRFLVLAVPVVLLPAALVAETLIGHSLTLVDAALTAALLLVLLARAGGVVRALDVNQRRFRRLFADAPAGMAILARDGRITAVNGAICAIARSSEEALVGRHFLEFIRNPDQPTSIHRFREALERGVQPEPAERMLRVPDGSEVTTLLSFSLLGSELVVHVQDVTESRRLQRELAERNELLERADRLKDDLIAVVSHDLRTPLTSIMGYLELALDDASGPPLSEERRDYLGVARRNCERLHRLVEDLLFVSRARSGRAGLECETLDVGRIVRDAVENALPTASAAGIALHSDCDRDLAADVDAHRVAEAVENLLSNALKFTPRGGRVDVRASGDDEVVTLRVVDTGVGVAEEDLEHLFDRFFRASAAEAVPGTGLGLSIVKAIVDAHEGSVSVESVRGEGTTFTIELPRSVAVRAAAAVA